MPRSTPSALPEGETGLPAQTMIDTRRMHGLPEPSLASRAFSDEDIEAARWVMLLLDAGFEEEQTARSPASWARGWPG
jgi:hypothetical protein